MNGQDFRGNFDFTFTTMLQIHRTVPMAGPVQGNTKTKIIGAGFKPSKSNVDLKWGVMSTESLSKDQVTEYVYTQHHFENIIEGSEEIKAYIYEASDFKRVDSVMVEETSYHSIFVNTPELNMWNKTQGGPYYVEVGKDIEIEVTSAMKGIVLNSEDRNASETLSNSTQVVKKEKNLWTFYEYDPSNVEFYFYKDSITKEVHPHSALTTGGTPISIIGAWFKFMPEYGVVPHCKFGNKIVRA